MNTEHGRRPFVALSRTFIGREGELAHLGAAWQRAASGEGGVVLVVGEPGVGKTSLCEQLAEIARAGAGQVLLGNCYEEASHSLPYLPFVQAIRSHLHGANPEIARRELGANAAQVVRIVPEVRDMAEVDPLPAALTIEEDLWYLLEGLTSYLKDLSREQPALLILEDLHWADGGTLALLRHLGRSLADSRLLVVCTYRDEGVDGAHPLAGVVADLRRSPAFSRLHLRGLTERDVQRMLGQVAGAGIGLGICEQVHLQTDGNPLFVEEVIRHLVEEGVIGPDESAKTAAPDPLLASLPEGLRAVIGRRLARLSPECHRVLAVAAVLGRDFRLDVLSDVVQLPGDGLLAAIEEAAARGVVEEQRGGGALGYRFNHALVRQALYEEIFTPRRIQLHQEVARALETRYAGHLDEHAAELAEHLFFSADPEGLAKAVDYAERAAARARAVFDHREAARLLGRALDVQQSFELDARARRCDLLIARCEALAAANEPGGADADAEQAFRLACDLGDTRRAASAAALGAGICSAVNASLVVLDPRFQAWVRRLDEYAHAGTAARVMADTFLASMPGTSATRTTELRASALQTALETADPDAVRWAAGIMLGFEPLTMIEVHELVRLINSTAGGRFSNLAMALFYGGARLLREGLRSEGERIHRRLIDLTTMAPNLGSAMHAVVAEVNLDCLDGCLEGAVEIACQRSGTIGEVTVRSAIMRPLLYLGRAQEYIEQYLVDGVPMPGARRWYANAFALAGDHERARRCLADRPYTWLLQGELNALEAAIVLGDERAVTGSVAAISAAPRSPATPAAWFTIPDRHLGAGYAFLGEKDRALEAYHSALAIATTLRFRPEVALTRLGLAELLIRHFPGEREEALEHLEFAIAEFGAMKMAPSLETALGLQSVQDGLCESGTAPAAAGFSGREVEVLRLIAAGLTNQQIAERLGISQHTVVRHISNILRKAPADNRAAATAYAMRLGLLN